MMPEGEVYVLATDPRWVDGFLRGRWPGLTGGEHLTALDIDKVTSADRVYIIGGWDKGLSRFTRVRIEKALHDSGARIFNGAGSSYDWGTPPPWEHDGTEPGSAVS